METPGPALIEQLTTEQAWHLVCQARVGRVAVVTGDHPDIFPVNHVVDRKSIVLCTDEGAKMLGASGHAVAFEVDGLDASSGQAWSVVAKGDAHEVSPLTDLTDDLDLPLFTWATGAKLRFLLIDVAQISGRRFQVTPSAAGDHRRHVAAADE